MSLHYEITLQENLTVRHRQQMLKLMQTHYLNVDPETFSHDLVEKEWVIILYDSNNQIAGFSTLLTFDFTHASQNLKIAFSGDTIISPDHWGTMQLPLAFGHLMNRLQESSSGRPLYWMLISKGFRTYRFLPVFFRTFYPCCKWPTPAFEQSLIHALGAHRYPANYQGGILRAKPGSQILKRELAGSVQHTVRHDPHIEFFFRQNPGHARGDELVCLAPYHWDNLRAYIRRQLAPATEVVLP